MYCAIKFELYHLKQYMKINATSNLRSRITSSNVVSITKSYCSYVPAFPWILVAF